MNKRTSKITIAALLAGTLLLTACASNIASADTGEKPSFASIDEARAAVDEVLACEDDPTADPLENRIVNSTVEYAMCTEHVQIELYASDEDRETSVEGYSTSAGGGYDRMPISMVAGSNWLVHDLSEARGLPSRAEDLEKLAHELGGTFTSVAAIKAK